MTTAQIQTLIRLKAQQYGIPPELAIAQARKESSFNPNATGGKGEQGLFQLLPSTARELGVTNGYDPGQNIDGGLRYLRQQYDRFGSWDVALAAYNAGATNVTKYGGIPPFASTRSYVAEILHNAGMDVLPAPVIVLDPEVIAGGADGNSTDPDPFADVPTVYPDIASITPSSSGLVLLLLAGVTLFWWLSEPATED